MVGQECGFFLSPAGARNLRSNIRMDIPHPIDQRLTALEIKASFTEDLVEQLNQVIIRQQTQIDALIFEIQRLREHSRDAGSGPSGSPRDELPPHY